ncbi:MULTISPECIES: GntR family transcriptional regulator [Actinomycetes]|uniref:GntR family transcriptional regulator n=1 Tax=Quadrisphaera setariae TaxID=2593304 RepID=A0A5C8Z5K6_9ACTN|nr:MULTISPECIES: GntR family transcriptional regulator [Actinomycetes]TNM60404.1 GntR family transcriptional regulator [Streptomyces sp. NP160]TXR52468.1 GntR family transcriptional regulator [Quadrisphaera setariae]
MNAAPTTPGPADAVLPERGSGTPVWAQVQADVRRRLDAGAFADGVPGENALAEEYGVSRQTVRQALRPLREAGALTAQRGRTSRAVGITQPLGALYSLFASVRATGMTQRSRVLALDVVTDGGASAALGLPADAELVHLRRVRLADDVPLALDEAWLPAARTRALLQADFTETALYDELARHCGIHVRGGAEHLHAVVTTPAEAALLGVAPGSAAFLVERLGCSEGTPVEHRRSLVRADRFSVSAHFAPSSGYQFQFDAERPGRPDGPAANPAHHHAPTLREALS